MFSTLPKISKRYNAVHQTKQGLKSFPSEDGGFNHKEETINPIKVWRISKRPFYNCKGRSTI